MNSLIKTDLCVKSSPIHGWGVFAESDIAPGDIIEECHVLFLEQRDPALDYYLFGVRNLAKEVIPCLVLGYGSIYNHAFPPNATYSFDEEKKVMRFTARMPIRCGEEIFTNYGDDWFCSRNTLPVQASKWFMFKSCFHRYRRLARGLLFTTALLLGLELLRSL